MSPIKWSENWPRGIRLEEWKYNECFLELFTHENDFIKEFLLDWLAFIIQNDNLPIRRYLLIRDRSGGGLTYWFLQIIVHLILPMKFPVLIRSYTELDSIKEKAFVVVVVDECDDLEAPEWLNFFELREDVNVIILVKTDEHFPLAILPQYSTFETSHVEVHSQIKVEAYVKKHLSEFLKHRDISEFTKWISKYLKS